MRWFLALVVLTAASSPVPAETNSRFSSVHAQVATWSRSAQPLPNAFNSDPAIRSARIPSPNGKYEIACSVVAREQKVSESVSETLEAPACDLVLPDRRMPIDLRVGSEALWAPDSDAVAITHSNGGAQGTYEVLIYRPNSNGPVELASAVRRDLAHRFPACAGSHAGCSADELKKLRSNSDWVNVAAIHWMQRSDRLLMMAWVPDSTSFGANLGRLNGYMVDAHSGRILQRYSEQEFKRRFRKFCGDWGL